MKDGLSRTGVAAIVAAIVFVALIVGGVTSVVQKTRQNRAALTEFNAVSESINKDAREKVGKEDTVTGATDKAQQLQDALGKAAASSTGGAAQVLRAVSHLMGDMKVRLASYEAAYSAFLATGGLQPKSLTSDHAIDERIALLKTFEAKNQEFTEFLSGAEKKLREELTKEGFPAREMDGAVKGFLENANIDTLIAIRGTDAELCTAMFQYLQLLKDEWGKWKLNGDEAVVFQSNQAADQFNGYAQQLQEVSERQAELQKKVLEARQQHGRAAGKSASTGSPP